MRSRGSGRTAISSNPDNQTIHSVCPHDCPDTCSIISHVTDGRLVRVEGNPNHPVTRGFICRKIMRAPERVYDPERLLYPMKRVGAKGEGRFERISWDQAIAVITGRWREICGNRGGEAILPFFGSGTEGLVNGHIAGRRFFNRLGSLQLDRTICTKAGRTGYRYTMGSSVGAEPTAVENIKLIIAWGVNTASTNIHQNVFFNKARKGGAMLAVINPIEINGAGGADFFLRPRPGSDGALALGMMNVIIEEDLYDREFVNNFTTGFDALRDRVKQYPPEQVEALTGVSAEDITAFARLYASQPSSFIYLGPGCQRHSNGGMMARTVACLPALTGAWARPGGGMYFPTSTVFPVDWEPLEGNELRHGSGGARYNMIRLAEMLEGNTPKVESLYVFNGNPATVLYNQGRVIKELERDDLFCVVHEQFVTDTARYADILLPATSQFEHPDILFSYYHPSMLLNRPAIAPEGECRSNLDVFASLAEAMKFDEQCFRKDAWEVIDEVLELDDPVIKGIDKERLFDRGWAEVKVDNAYDHYCRGSFPTPSGKIEFFSQTMMEDGYDPLPVYTPPLESPEATPELFNKYPLFLITPSSHSILNSNYARDAGALESEKRPTLVIHPDDAGPRNIDDAQQVRVFNDRGECLLWARVSKTVKSGVVACHGLWWNRRYPGGQNANRTTPDFTSDMAGGSAFNSNLVEVEPASTRG